MIKYFSLAVVLVISSGCAKYKFKGESDSERTIIPLSAVEQNEALLDQFPCGNSGVEIECHEPKVEICHVPPGNPANAHTLCIGHSAVKAHLRNHIADSGEEDFLGDCEGGGDDGGSGIVED